MALLVDGLVQPAWVARVVADIGTSPAARIVLVVENGAIAAPERAWARVRQHPEFAVYWAYRAVDRHLFGPGRAGEARLRPAAEAQPLDPFRPVDLADLVGSAHRLVVHPRQTRFSDYFDDEDLEAICAHDLDVALRFGFRILRGRALDIARHGVWSHHHGDNRRNRGGPAAFWEVFHREPVSGAVLQILNEDLDNGVVIARTFSSTDHYSVTRNEQNVYWSAAALVPRKLEELHRNGPSCLEAAYDDALEYRPYSERLYSRPKNREMARLLVRHGATVVGERVRGATGNTSWGLAYHLGSGPAVMHRFRYLIPPDDRLWADPFPIEHEGGLHMFFEEHVHGAPAGHISVMTLDDDGRWGPPRVALERPYHLSYPCVFEWQGDLFMVPETAQAKRVELFRCTRFPCEWERDAVLLEDVRACDATVAEHDGRWWMFVAMAAEGVREYEDLHIFSAPTPRGPWVPHGQNPVVSDVRRARPAGRLFRWNGRLYRPSQDSGRRYGYRIRINRIEHLDDEMFEETEVSRIEPGWDTRVLATHTINMTPRLTAVDMLWRSPLLRGARSVPADPHR